VLPPIQGMSNYLYKSKSPKTLGAFAFVNEIFQNAGYHILPSPAGV